MKKKPISRSKLTVGTFSPRDDDQVIICRCEEITKGEIRSAIHQGMVTMNELKRYLRIGMGLCQGQTCQKLVAGLLARELGVSTIEVEHGNSRAPARPVPMGIYANDQYAKARMKGGDTR